MLALRATLAGAADFAIGSVKDPPRMSAALPTLRQIHNLIAMVMWVAIGFSNAGCNFLTHRWPERLEQDEPTGKWQAKFASVRKRAIDLQRPEKTVASHQRNWRPDLSVLPYAEIRNDRVRLYNIRDCEYRTEESYDVRHFDREILLADVRTIDFIVVPFKETPMLAHTMLSFGMANGEHLVFSVEARLQQGQS